VRLPALASISAAILCLAALTPPPRAVAAERSPRTVVLLLFDGLAPSLLENASAPTLERIRREGAWTHRMIPVFPTISLVNQISISTGCWPENHGIVSNVFLDPDRGLYDHAHEADWLTGCEHLHQAVERQQVRSAALGWVGRFSSRGDLASAVSLERVYEEFPDDGRRVDQVIQMLRMEEPGRPRLILAYFKGPDWLAHSSGIRSWKTRQAVEASDAHVGQILAEINALPFRDEVTLLVTTDHGMVPVTHNVNVNRILLNHRIDARYRSSGTTSFLYFSDPAEIDRAYEALSRYTQFDVVRKGEQPEDWRLGTGPRVGDLILSAKPPYFIEDIERWPAWTRWLGTWGPEFLWARMSIKASHGYPPDTPGVEGTFYAWGAGIAAGREVESIRAIDVHPTVTELLDLAPGSPVDGEAATNFLASRAP
jgi:predicted AlkP superfamily pyrophosphatase or phosphodiesterase